MSKKILFCATVDYHFSAFHLPYLKWFKEQGWEVHVAANGDMILPFVDEKFNIPISRSPFNLNNNQAYKQLKSIIDENKYNIIHCHTPVGGVLARIASRQARRMGTKVIYTAHGFHFCKGGSKKNWLIYYPIEKWLSNDTDCLITINDEDYKLASRHRFKAKRIEHVHGVGVNIDRYKPLNVEGKMELRKSYGYMPSDFLMFYAAEFNKNKNQRFLIESLNLIKREVPYAKLLLAGKGPLLEDCRKLAIELGIEDKIDFLGYRNDIEYLLKISDIAVASSQREGLPVNIMEAMACELPVIATLNRGHSELVKENRNGYIIPKGNHKLFGSKLVDMYRSKEQCKQMGLESRNLILKFSLANVGEELGKVYSSYMEDKDETESKHHRAYI